MKKKEVDNKFECQLQSLITSTDLILVEMQGMFNGPSSSRQIIQIVWHLQSIAIMYILFREPA